MTRQEQADETLEASPPQLEAKVGRAVADTDEAVKVGQNWDTAEEALMNCLRQLSWLQLGAMAVGVAVLNAVDVGVDSFLYSSNTTSDPMPGHTITSS